jgi:adenylosuccinate synthase
MKQAEQILPMMADVSRELNDAHRAGANLLFEGAQGTLLDVDHGTYPFVTSSNCVAGNAAAGSGVGPGMLHYVLGITKAYCTRVGGGPFPTELDWETPGTVGYHLSTVGAEKGRDHGPQPPLWLVRRRLAQAQCAGQWPYRACVSPSWTCWTALQRAATVHRLRARRRNHRHPAHGRGRDRALQADLRNHGRLEQTAPWVSPTTTSSPVNARLYLQRIAQVTGVPVAIVSTSPDRDHTIMRAPPVPGQLGLSSRFSLSFGKSQSA